MEELNQASSEYITEQTQLTTGKYDDRFWQPTQAGKYIDEFLKKSYLSEKDKIISPEAAHLLIYYIDFAFQYAHPERKDAVCVTLQQILKDVKLSAWTARSKNNLRNGLNQRANDFLQSINRRGDNNFQLVNALIHELLKNEFDEQEINKGLRLERRKNSWVAKRVDSFNKLIISFDKSKSPEAQPDPFLEELKKRLEQFKVVSVEP